MLESSSTLPTELHERVFIGIFPGAISYADRTVEERNDYKQLALLPYDTLELWFATDRPERLKDYIRSCAAPIQARRGEHFRISTCGQTVLLGSGQ